MKRIISISTIHIRITVWLLLLMCFLLIMAYQVRPTVRIDLGDYYDSIYLQDFHDREVDAAGGGEMLPFPPDQQQATLHGHRDGVWIVTLSKADDQPDDALKGLSMSVNGQRLNIARQSGSMMVGVLPPDLAAADNLVVQLEPGLREGPQPPAGLVGSVKIEPARTYRWSRGESHIVLPGLGRGAWQLDMLMVTSHPNQQLVNAEIVVNDSTSPLVKLPDQPALRRVSMLVPPAMTQQGDIDILLRSNTFADPRPLGVFVSDVVVKPIGTPQGSSIVQTLPPWSVLFYSIGIVLVMYVCMAVLTIPEDCRVLGRDYRGIARDAPTVSTQYAIATLASIATAIALTVALSLHRFPTTFMLPGMALLAGWSLVLLFVLRPILLKLFATASSPSSKLSATTFVNTLLLIFFVGYWVKAIGMLYPYFIGIDVHWHMDRVRWILNGDLPLLYGTDSPLNDSTMPLAEWGYVKPVIPYSPFYHMFAAGFVLFPWSLEMSANMVSVFFDSLHVVLIGLLVYRGGLSKRAGLLAALLYTVLPVRFLLHSWGNVPTTTGMASAFAATVCIIIVWNQMQRKRNFVLLTFLLITALLFYTVAGVFVGAFLVSFTFILLLLMFTTRNPSVKSYTPLFASGLRTLWLSVAAAIIIVMVVYYGQYIGPIIDRTIPYFLQSFTSSAESIGKASDTFSDYIIRHTRLWTYGIAIPLILTLVWMVQEGRAIWQRKGLSPSSDFVLLWAAVSGWMMLTLAFLVVAFKVSMVDKHFFISIPVMVIASGSLLDRLWRRGWIVRGAILLFYVYLAYSAWCLWLMRIVTVKQ